MNTTDLKQGDRVKLISERSASRYFVLSVNEGVARLISTAAPAGKGYLIEWNVKTTPAADVEVDPKPVKTRLASAWISYEAGR